MRHPPPYHLHQALGYQLSLTSRTTERPFEEALKQFGLTRITWCILIAVLNEGLSMPSEIAGFIGIDRTATSRALKALEKAGLIDRASGTSDKRTTRVRLTPAGHALMTQAVPVAQFHRAHFADKLTPSEQKQLFDLLAKLRVGEDTSLSTF